MNAFQGERPWPRMDLASRAAPRLLWMAVVMDDTKFTAFLTFVLTLLIVSSTASTEEVNDAGRIHQLEAQFASAHFTPVDRDQFVRTRAWRCSLYGARSKVLFEKNIDLYEFSRRDATTFRNGGAEPIVIYQEKDGALEGHGTQGLVDQIRLTDQGELIAKLSHPERGTIAFALCRGVLTPVPTARLIEARWSGFSSSSASY